MVKLSTLLNGWGLLVPTSSHLCPGLIRVPAKWSMPGLDTGQSSGPPQCPWRIGKRGQDHPTRIFGFWTFYVLWLNQFWTPHNYSCINTQSRLNCVVWDIWAEKGVWSVWKWDDGCLSVWRPTYHQLLPRPRQLWTLKWYSVFFFTWKAAGGRLKVHPSHLSVDCQWFCHFWHLFSRYLGLVNFQCVGWHLRFRQ